MEDDDLVQVNEINENRGQHDTYLQNGRESLTSDALKHQILDEFHEYQEIEPEDYVQRNSTQKGADELDNAHKFTFKKSTKNSFNKD